MADYCSKPSWRLRFKVLSPGSYNVSDAKYPSMEGTVRVQDNMHSNW